MNGRGAGPVPAHWPASRLVEWLEDLAVEHGLARRRALRRWRRAGSLADLGELTASWLAGELAAQPGYYGRVDVDEDKAPGLTDALVTACRAGLVTTSSQAGRAGQDPSTIDGLDATFDDAFDDGRRWTQLAWVSGFAESRLVQYLACAAEERDDVEVVVLAPPEQTYRRGFGAGGDWVRTAQQVAVTWFDGRPVTVDRWMPRPVIREEVYPGVGHGALDEVYAATQVAILDPVAGRNTLWAWLCQTLARARQTTGPSPAAGSHRDRGPGLGPMARTASGLAVSHPGAIPARPLPVPQQREWWEYRR